MTDDPEINPSDIVIYAKDAEDYWRQRFLPVLLRALGLIIVSCYLVTFGQEDLSFSDVFTYGIVLIVIPFYWIFWIAQDNIHYLILSPEKCTITINWTKRGCQKGNCVLNVKEIGLTIQTNHFLRNGKYLRIAFSKFEERVIIKQYLNSNWPIDKMEYLIKMVSLLPCYTDSSLLLGQKIER